MIVLLKILAVTLLLLLVQEALRRTYPWGVWALFLLLPILLTPYWIQVNNLGLFSWFKFYTVFFCVCWGEALRFTSLGSYAAVRRTIPLLLAVNIFEATVVDLLAGGAPHLLNAGAGLLLIAIMAYGDASTRIDSSNRCRDLLYKVSKRWVIGYTLWNWTFVYLNYPSLTGHHTGVLAAGLIVALIAPQRWSQTRASTLGFHLLLTATDYNGLVTWLDSAAWFDSRLAFLAASISLAWTLGLVVMRHSQLASPCAKKGTAPSAAPWGRLQIGSRTIFHRPGCPSLAFPSSAPPRPLSHRPLSRRRH